MTLIESPGREFSRLVSQIYRHSTRGQDHGAMYKGEKFNSISHLVGAALATAGLAVLVILAARQGDLWKVASFSVYGTTLLLLFIFSTLYHSLRGKAKNISASSTTMPSICP